MFWVSPCLGLGPYPLPEAAKRLHAGGISHVLNVAEARGSFDPTPFVEVAFHPLDDLRLLPTPLVDACLRSLERMLREPNARVYVHCSAGQNRSPTILWLYLIACGLEPEEAGAKIAAASFDACPGHPALIDEALVTWARAVGKAEGL